MLGAIAGDIIGSQFEGFPPFDMTFGLFRSQQRATDDSVLTIAVAEAILDGIPFDENLRKWYSWYPNAGYGHGFMEWANDPTKAKRDSWGNGSIMRTSPCGYLPTLEEARAAARAQVDNSHTHPEAVRSAQVVTSYVWLAQRGELTTENILKLVAEYPDFNIDYIPAHGFNIRSKNTACTSIAIALRARTFEEGIRRLISLGGDTDTHAAVGGAILGAKFGVPEEIAEQCKKVLDQRQLDVIERFEKKYVQSPVAAAA
jgi:ADP-ribosylglycohydrolase